MNFDEFQCNVFIIINIISKMRYKLLILLIVLCFC